MQSRPCANSELSPWFSPIADPRITRIPFKHRANGHYLEFLSSLMIRDKRKEGRYRFFAAARIDSLPPQQLDRMPFPTCQAQTLRRIRRIADDFIRRVGAVGLAGFHPCSSLNLGVDNHASDEDGEKFLYFKSVNRIRQLAVHRCSTYRWNFDTRTQPPVPNI